MAIISMSCGSGRSPAAPAGGPAVIMTPQMIIGFASGFMLPNALAGAVSVRPQAAGAAAGITGFMQMGLGAATSQLIGHLLDGAQTAFGIRAQQRARDQRFADAGVGAGDEDAAGCHEDP